MIVEREFSENLLKSVRERMPVVGVENFDMWRGCKYLGEIGVEDYVGMFGNSKSYGEIDERLLGWGYGGKVGQGYLVWEIRCRD